MQLFDNILSIIASVFSVAATIIALKNNEEIKKLRDLFQGNELTMSGDGNAQVLGSSNQVNTHVN